MSLHPYRKLLRTKRQVSNLDVPVRTKSKTKFEAMNLEDGYDKKEETKNFHELYPIGVSFYMTSEIGKPYFSRALAKVL